MEIPLPSRSLNCKFYFSWEMRWWVWNEFSVGFWRQELWHSSCIFLLTLGVSLLVSWPVELSPFLTENSSAFLSAPLLIFQAFWMFAVPSAGCSPLADTHSSPHTRVCSYECVLNAQPYPFVQWRHFLSVWIFPCIHPKVSFFLCFLSFLPHQAPV